MKAVEAARPGELVLLIPDEPGTSINLVDVPVIAWVVDPDGVTPPVPVTPWTLTAQWARIDIERRHLTPGLIGAARIAVVMGDQTWRGSFSEFLDHLVALTGQGVRGVQLVNGTLVSAFWSWVSGRHGGRTFPAAGPA
jgi:hypothetical protein